MEQKITITLKKSSIYCNELLQKLEGLTMKVNSTEESLQSASTLDEVSEIEKALMELFQCVNGVGKEIEESAILISEHREQLKVKYEELYNEINLVLS